MREVARLGVTWQEMLTGDRRRAAEVLAHEAGIENLQAELLPEQKLDRVRQLVDQGRAVAMIGDGINDAPALAAATVGVAVGGAADITAEAAGAVYLPHSLEHLPLLVEVSRRAVFTAWQNIILFAGVVNLVAVYLAASGTIGPLGAAITHQLSSLFVMLNSLRLLSTRRWRLPPLRPLLKPAAITAAVLVLLNGFYILGPDEVGGIQRFGRKVLPYALPGPHYKLPWPIEKLTRVQARRIRVVEVGFRSSGAAAPEPAAYEWNVQHRAGRFERRPDESLMLTGDQNMIEVNATVHYRLSRPDDFLFRQLDGDGTVRAATESVLQGVASTSTLDAMLTTGRRQIEQRVRQELSRRLARYAAGVEVLDVRLLDVHPSLEVVDAFRDVSGAYEEKNRLINEAEGYRNEQVATARGNAAAKLETARGYSIGRKNRAEGDAARFLQAEAAFRAAPGPTETRLYLETMEQVLPGRQKIILDGGKGRRHLVLLEDGVEVPTRMFPREERQ